MVDMTNQKRGRKPIDPSKRLVSRSYALKPDVWSLFDRLTADRASSQVGTLKAAIEALNEQEEGGLDDDMFD